MISADQIIPTISILDQKRGNEKEILLILFEKCNLKCTFCHQDHDSTVGIEDIYSHAERLMRTYPKSGEYCINISGGEIFLDELPDGVFEQYRKLVLALHDYFDCVAFTFVTNMIFSKTDRVLALMTDLVGRGIDVTMATSYDPVGRFNGKIRTQFEQNVLLFQRFIRVVTTVLTKRTVRWFSDGGEDPLFDSIYRRFHTYFDHYTPDRRGCDEIPSDVELADFYIVMSDRYPNIQPLKGWMTGAKNITTCRKTVVTTPTGEISSCRALPREDRNNELPGGEVVRIQSEEAFLSHYGCFECEYYSRCGLRCFLAHEYSAEKDTICHYKRLFDHLTKL